MSWAETLKINSDPSTPLNEFIESKMRYISSDNVLSVLARDLTVTSSEKTILSNKVMKYPGVLDIRLGKPSSFPMYLYVYKNDTKILTINAGEGSFHSATFEFDKGDYITVSVKRAGSSNGTLTHISLGGMVAFGDF